MIIPAERGSPKLCTDIVIIPNFITLINCESDFSFVESVNKGVTAAPIFRFHTARRLWKTPLKPCISSSFSVENPVETVDKVAFSVLDDI